MTIRFLKYSLFFWLAALPAMLVAKTMPKTPWEWWLWGGYALYQGLLAMKALQSDADTSDDPPPKVEIVNTAEKPVETHEANPLHPQPTPPTNTIK